MNRWLRILKHRWLDENDARRALGRTALERLQQRVAASETRHSGEIRVCVEAGLPLSYLWRGATARERAVTLFGKLRVWDTEQNNGVLIYLLLAEHRIEIVADRGLDRHVGAAQWQAIVGSMREAFAAGRFEDGLNAAIAAVHALLVQHFALEPGRANPNELPDAPLVR
jgi:uncharacterized membrane protein